MRLMLWLIVFCQPYSRVKSSSLYCLCRSECPSFWCKMKTRALSPRTFCQLGDFCLGYFFPPCPFPEKPEALRVALLINYGHHSVQTTLPCSEVYMKTNGRNRNPPNSWPFIHTWFLSSENRLCIDLPEVFIPGLPTEAQDPLSVQETETTPTLGTQNTLRLGWCLRRKLTLFLSGI